MNNDIRLEIYKKLIASYDMFTMRSYNDCQRELGQVLEMITYKFEQEYSSMENSWVQTYYENIMNYSRKIRTNVESMRKQFVEFLHRAMYQVSNKRVYRACSYIRDMKTIVEKLNG